jgi:putative DNA primase/helicase
MTANGPPLRAYTDLGNAERFALEFGHRARYVAKWGRWLVWDGLRWAEDSDGAAVRLAHAMIRTLYQAAADLKDDDERIRLLRHAVRSENAARIRALLECASVLAGIPIELAALDARPMRLTVANGTLDLSTGTLVPARPEDFITKLTPVAFDAAARCPRWDAFLDRVVPNAAVRRFLQRAAGYSLTGSTKEQVLFFLHGSGANGKSTFLEILRALAGDLAKQADFATLLERRDVGGPRSDLARLMGARIVTASEAAESRRLDETVIKSLTGGDTVSARPLYIEAIEFRPQLKLWMSSNDKPHIRGTDEGIWRRVRLVPFTEFIPPEERNGDLEEELRAELPGILSWAVRGCLEWQRDGLGEPEAVHEATQKYRDEEDAIGQFIDERCIRDTDVKPPPVQPSETPAKPLYHAYVAWCAENGSKTVTATKFGRELSLKGYEVKKETTGKRAKLRCGIRLVSESQSGDGKTAGSKEPVVEEEPVGTSSAVCTRSEEEEEATIAGTGSNCPDWSRATAKSSNGHAPMFADEMYEFDERRGMADA